MGGHGSGTWYRWDTKPKLESMRSLNINRMMQTKAIPQNGAKAGLWCWMDSETGEQTSSLNYYSDTACEKPFIRLQYTIKDTDEECDYNIYLDVTKPHYGGKRFWFICPYTGERVTKLYRPYGSSKYASRHAFNLKHASNSEGRLDRLIRKKWKIQNKLGGENYFIKPKNMHHETHERMIDEIWKLDNMIDIAMIQRFNLLTSR